MRKIDEAEFNELVAQGGPMVVDMWAEWCGPCRVMGPMLDNISRAYEGSVAFYKCNVDENPQLARRFNVMSIPTLLMFRDGRKVSSIVGATGPDRVVSAVDEAFGD